MKSFILKTIRLILIFFSILLSVVFIWDPYQTIHPNNQWDANAFSFNREWVCLNVYQQRLKDNKPPTHFIIGSSRSHAFKTKDWAHYADLNPNSIFHFDAFGMGILRAQHLIQFLSQQRPAPQEIIWIIDHTIFNESEESDRFIFSEPPQISRKNPIPFHTKALYECLHPSFVFRNLSNYYSIGNDIESQDEFTQNETVNDFTGDIYYQKKDILISKDSAVFYSNKKTISKFSPYMNVKETLAPKAINNEQIDLLRSIERDLKANGTRIKIIVSPLYAKIKMHPSDLQHLSEIFGSGNIYDFSGSNDWTTEYRNYYDPSHFRPHIAKKMLSIIYSH
jgi:hypothetical protein